MIKIIEFFFFILLLPTNVLPLCTDCVNCLATPKSANLTSPCSDNNTFAAEDDKNRT